MNTKWQKCICTWESTWRNNGLTKCENKGSFVIARWIRTRAHRYVVSVGLSNNKLEICFHHIDAVSGMAGVRVQRDS